MMPYAVFLEANVGTNVYFRKIFYIYRSLNKWPESGIAKKMMKNLDEYFGEVSYVNAIVAVSDP